VHIAAEQIKAVLAAESCDPEVIGWNRLPRALQVNPDDGVMVAGSLADFKNWSHGNRIRQPSLIFTLPPGLQNAEPVFAEHDYGNRDTLRSGKTRSNVRIAIGSGREGVRIQDQIHSSGSIFSNSASISRLILAVSFRKWRNCPTMAIQGFSFPFELARIFSSTASVTNWRSGMPR
jgi:hypothetical protein